MTTHTCTAETGWLTVWQRWRSGWQLREGLYGPCAALYIPDVPGVGPVLVRNPHYLGTQPMTWWEGAEVEKLLADPDTVWTPVGTAEVEVELTTRGERRRFELAYAYAGGYARQADRGRGVIDTTPLRQPAEPAPQPDDDIVEFDGIRRVPPLRAWGPAPHVEGAR